MRIGIFAKTYARPTLDDTFAAVAADGIDAVQMNLSVAGCDTVPAALDPAVTGRIAAAAAAAGIEIVAVSGTFNMADPDPRRVRAGLHGLRVLASGCAAMGTGTITLCTGSRHPHDMWCHHPDNRLTGTWHALLQTMAEAVQIAEHDGVTLAFEPELANVVSTPARARRLLDEIRSPRLKVVIDPANLVHPGQVDRAGPALEEAFDLLGPDIVLAHAKDVSADPAGGHVAAGQGMTDFARYIELAEQTPARALVLHGLAEHEVPGCVAFLQSSHRTESMR